MNQERILKVLRAAHVSEKATILADQNGTFVFKVAKDANKLEIKKAVEALFEVKVKAVRTANMKGKSKFFVALRVSALTGRRPMFPLRKARTLTSWAQSKEGSKE